MESFKLFSNIGSAKKVCLIAHISPDADALASMVILQDFIKDHFKIKTVDIFAEGNSLPENLSFILSGKKLNPKPQKYDAAIIMDSPNLERVGCYKELYDYAKIKMVIDHHATGNITNCINFSKEVSSTCEIVYDLFTYYKYKLTKSQLAKIYVGLLTDTDGFSVGALNSHVFEIASACANDVDCENLYSIYLKNNTLLNQQLYSQVVLNIKQINPEVITTYITGQQLKKYKAGEDDLFGITNQLNTIYKAKLICFIRPSNNNAFYVSLRAKKGYNVAEIAKRFGGGGHIGASGFVSNKPIIEIIDMVNKEFEIQLSKTKPAKIKLF